MAIGNFHVHGDVVGERMVVWEDGQLAEWSTMTNGVERPAVLVDRARFERLRNLAGAADAFRTYQTAGDLDAAILGILGALDALQPGDLDPLP